MSEWKPDEELVRFANDAVQKYLTSDKNNDFLYTLENLAILILTKQHIPTNHCSQQHLDNVLAMIRCYFNVADVQNSIECWLENHDVDCVYEISAYLHTRTWFESIRVGAESIGLVANFSEDTSNTLSEVDKVLKANLETVLYSVEFTGISEHWIAPEYRNRFWWCFNPS